MMITSMVLEHMQAGGQICLARESLPVLSPGTGTLDPNIRSHTIPHSHTNPFPSTSLACWARAQLLLTQGDGTSPADHHCSPRLGSRHDPLSLSPCALSGQTGWET